MPPALVEPLLGRRELRGESPPLDAVWALGGCICIADLAARDDLLGVVREVDEVEASQPSDTLCKENESSGLIHLNMQSGHKGKKDVTGVGSVGREVGSRQIRGPSAVRCPEG